MMPLWIPFSCPFPPVPLPSFAFICSSCGCLQRDSFRLVLAHCSILNANTKNLIKSKQLISISRSLNTFEHSKVFKRFNVGELSLSSSTSLFCFQVCFLCLEFLLTVPLASLLCLAVHVKSVPSLFQPRAHCQAPPSKLKPHTPYFTPSNTHPEIARNKKGRIGAQGQASL